MDIKLNFINLSNDASNHDIVFFQNNVATDFESLATAWKVIRNCGYGNYHPFVFPTESFISASDSYGNFTPHLPVCPGQAFHVHQCTSGNQLGYKGPSSSVCEIELVNDLVRGAVGANIFKAGRLFARKTGIAPAQKAVFQFRPSLLAAVSHDVTEGLSIESVTISAYTTELSLLGIASADIIMMGGGAGCDARAFSFHLDNVVWA